MITNLPEVLEWKYGRVAGCEWNEKTGWAITSWRHQSLQQPSAEQLENDATEHAAYRAKAVHNAPILAQLDALDKKRIRPLAEGDTAYLDTLNQQIIALRGTLLP